MNADWKLLKKELERVEGRTIRFGTYDGWTVEQVAQVDRGYLLWCLRSLPLSYELQRSILRALSRRAAALQSRRLHRLTDDQKTHVGAAT